MTTVHSLRRILILGALLAVPYLGTARAQTVEELPPAAEEEPTETVAPTRPLESEASLLSLQGGDRLVKEAELAVEAQDYSLAAQKLGSARRIYNQLSNFYQQLSSSFQGIDLRIADNHRSLALETAQKRDEATFQLALVHRANNEEALAVPLLIQIVRSQNPTTPLGSRAYQQLFDLGFVETQFPRNQATPR